MKRRLFTLLLAITEVAAAQLAQAAPLGRLFFTPDERLRIDQGSRSDPNAAIEQRPPAINGVVRRNDGRATIWLDGKAEQRTVRRLGDVITEMSRAPQSADDSATPSEADDAPRIDIRIHRK